MAGELGLPSVRAHQAWMVDEAGELLPPTRAFVAWLDKQDDRSARAIAKAIRAVDTSVTELPGFWAWMNRWRDN